ncbi:hypothetical protein SAMN02746095_02263 [Acidocella aminolytica 101 = DSM 11237]|nr:hypothetical protein SAMN02746095_02263 [Acidocella aminolytica 101 = DSM 11237]
MTTFIDEHREVYGVESIVRVLLIPSGAFPVLLRNIGILRPLRPGNLLWTPVPDGHTSPTPRA